MRLVQAAASEPFHVLQTGRCCKDSPGLCEVCRGVQIVLTVPVVTLSTGLAEGTLMVSAVVGGIIILSIGILLAHALDAFRSG
jgi:hypothetical protein